MKPLPWRILLVEDDPVSRAFLAAATRALPAHVDSAGTVATAHTRAGEQHYDLWLIDANLPDGSGIDLLRELRTLHPDTPALAHTADNERPVLDALLAAGFAQALVKPLAASALQAAVRQALATGTAPSTDGESSHHDTPPLWDDAAAALALNGTPGQAEALRNLFLAELPLQRDQIRSALASGAVDEARAVLHRLRAGCGFVGAARLGHAARALHEQPDSIATLQQLLEVIRQTLETPRPAQSSLAGLSVRGAAVRGRAPSLSHGLSPPGPQVGARTVRISRRRLAMSGAEGIRSAASASSASPVAALLRSPCPRSLRTRRAPCSGSSR